MRKCFCDNCGKEIDASDIKIIFLPETMQEKEFCEDCEKIYKKVSKRIEQRFVAVKKDAMKKYEEIKKEEMENLAGEEK